MNSLNVRRYTKGWKYVPKKIQVPDTVECGQDAKKMKTYACVRYISIGYDSSVETPIWLKNTKATIGDEVTLILKNRTIK